MTTRRGLFGWIVGALALGAGVDASPASGGIATGPLPLVGELPSESLLTPDDARRLSVMWNDYALSPTMIYLSPDGAAAIHAATTVKGPDPFGIRRRLAKRAFLRGLEQADDESIEMNLLAGATCDVVPGPATVEELELGLADIELIPGLELT